MRVSKSSIRIDAPRETVWSVVTEPGYVKQWQYGSDLHTDWSVGSPIRFTSEWEGSDLRAVGDGAPGGCPEPPRLLAFRSPARTWWISRRTTSR